MTCFFYHESEAYIGKAERLTEMELAADTDSDAYKKDRNVQDNEAEAELQEKQEEASVGEK
jgi:hypothetical protein